MRDLRIDFWRGLALVMIFINHIPWNAATALTLRNFGPSDSAEIFVFLAGYSAMLAFGPAHDRQGPLIASLRILRRCWQLYVAHLVLLVAALALVAAYAGWIRGADMLVDINAAPFFANPAGSLVDAVSLQFLPKFLDILPLYIVLMAAAVGIIPAARRWPLATFAASAAVYLLAQTTDLNFWAVRGEEKWSFNPLAWQFLFVLGTLASARVGAGLAVVPRSRPLQLAAMAIVGAGVIAAAPWTAVPALRSWSLFGANFIYSFDKADLSPVRLVHFLALALLAATFLPKDAAWLRGWSARRFTRAGQNALPIFCLGTLLSFLGQFAYRELGHGGLVQTAVNITGILVIFLTASVLAWSREQPWRERPAAAAGPALRGETGAGAPNGGALILPLHPPANRLTSLTPYRAGLPHVERSGEGRGRNAGMVGGSVLRAVDGAG